MWGGLFCGPIKGATEEDYYYSEYSPAEREMGHHLAASNFVSACYSLLHCGSSFHVKLQCLRLRSQAFLASWGF